MGEPKMELVLVYTSEAFHGSSTPPVHWLPSGFVPMANPFNDSGCHLAVGTDPVYGILAGQGNHSISTADIDGDGCMEIVYGAAAIDHDGSLLYSKYGTLPDGRTRAKFGHGDAMHVADIDPDSPGLEIFNVCLLYTSDAADD